MKAQFFNSSGCLIDAFESFPKDEGIERVIGWVRLLQTGDKIVALEVEEDENDPLDDFNYVGSRHHY